jgi:hypothetical protein
LSQRAVNRLTPRQASMNRGSGRVFERVQMEGDAYSGPSNSPNIPMLIGRQ